MWTSSHTKLIVLNKVSHRLCFIHLFMIIGFARVCGLLGRGCHVGISSVSLKLLAAVFSTMLIPGGFIGSLSTRGDGRAIPLGVSLARLGEEDDLYNNFLFSFMASFTWCRFWLSLKRKSIFFLNCSLICKFIVQNFSHR